MFSKADSRSYPCHSCDGCMDVLAQIGGNGRTNTFSQPLTLIECIRYVLKGLEMFSSEYLSRGYPPNGRAHVHSWQGLRTFPRAPLKCLHGKLDPLQVALQWSWCSTHPFCGELIYISCVHTPPHTPTPPTFYLHRPCFLTNSLLTPDEPWIFVYIVVNMDFSSLGFLFSFFLPSVLPCSFWFAFNLLDGCVPSCRCPLCSVIKGSGEAALVLPALLQGKSSACFSQLGKTKQNKTGSPMGPGGRSRATRD